MARRQKNEKRESRRKQDRQSFIYGIIFVLAIFVINILVYFISGKTMFDWLNQWFGI